MSDGISVLILATNEERDLPQALECARLVADEIVVVDGGSTDRTAAIAEAAGARVCRRAFDNFTEQRRFGLEQARGPWILMLDADERLSDELAREMRQAAAQGRHSAFEIPFEVEFMGRRLRFSGRRGEKHLRFFRKDAVEMKPGLSVHEQIEVKTGSVGRLSSKIVHRPYRDLGEYMAKCEIYTDLAAADFVRRGEKLSWRHRFIPAYEFLRCYIFYLGFLDGLPGLVWAALSGLHRYIRYQKIRLRLSA